MSKMRGKPTGMDEFRSGGNDDFPIPSAQIPKAVSPVAAPVVVAPVISTERSNKTIRIRKIFETRLKDEVYKRGKSTGMRVSESDLIDEALDSFFKSLDSKAE